MSTKVRANVRSVEGSTITLYLESPYFAVLQKDDDVFVELQTIQGTRVEFHLPSPTSLAEVILNSESPITDPSEPAKEEVILIEEPIEDSTVTTITDTPSSEPIEPAKESKASKKK